MKLGYQIINLIVAALLLASCSVDEIDTYDGVEYVYFGNQIVNYSFAYNPGEESMDIGFPVKLIGNSVDYDRKVNFFVEAGTENLEIADFELVPGVFRKGMFEDTIYVRLHNSEKLLTEEVSMLIRLSASEDFEPGPTYVVQALLNFSNKLIQPEWWNTAVTRDYLGDYSDKKYRTLIVATEVGDWTGLGASEKRSYAIMLANYIRENAVTEEDGTPMKVNVKY